MLEYDPYHSMFDSLGGQPKFDRLCDQLIPREFGNRAGYIPGPTGKDDGFDAKYIKQEVGKPHTQFKFRQIAGANGEKLRKEAVANFEKWLAEKCSPEDTGTYLYVTNVHRAIGDHRRTDKIIEKYPKATIYYWDFKKLSELMDTHADLADEFLTVWKSSELRKQRAELERKQEEQARKDKEQLRQTPEFKAAALKLKRGIIDPTRLDSQYLGFTYLAEPLYVDDRDGARAIIREMFTIDEDTEQEAISRLKAAGRIDITGNIVTVADAAAKQAQATAGEIVTHMGADLEKILTLIQGA